MHRIMLAMRNVLLGAAAAAVFLTTTYGQSILGPPSEANHFIGTPTGWVHPKTAWGEPDIQATLNMMQAANVPLERCANSYRFGGPPCDMNKRWYTEEEHKQRLAAAAGRGDLGRELIAKGEFGRALLTGVTDPATPQRQTNLIVDPPNGLLPALTPEAKRRALQMGSSWSLPGEDTVYDGPLDFDFWDNCRSRGMPSSMMPYRYNGGFKIHQAPGVVVFDLEMIHDARVVFTDGRPPLPAAHKQYMGNSRGRWEGETLVVETRGFSPRFSMLGATSNLHLVERFTRVAADVLQYDATLSDPATWTRPWTARLLFKRTNEPLIEYACHEGNVGLAGILSGARKQEAEEARKR